MHLCKDLLALPLSKRRDVLFLIILHSCVDLLEVQNRLIWFIGLPFVSISGVERKYDPLANYIKATHHGVPPSLGPLNTVRGADPTLFSRISSENGSDAAVHIVQRVKTQPL